MQKKLIVKQHDIKDCGACALLSIIRYYDGNIPLSKIKLDTKTNKDGTTAFNIVTAAKKYGFNSLGLKVTNLNEITMLPAIAHITLENGLQHFIVIYKYTKNNVLIMDPAKGFKKLPIKEFLNLWNNIILVFKPYQVIPYYEDKNYLLNYITTIIKEEKNILIKIIICTIITSLLSIILSFYLKVVVNISNFKTISILISIFIVLTLSKLIINYHKEKLLNNMNYNIERLTILPFINHIFKLPLNIIKSKMPGDISTKISELYNIKSLFTEIFISIILEGILSIGTMIALYILNNKLFLILFLLIIIYILFSCFCLPIIYKRINDNIDLETEFNSQLIEHISSLDSIKNLNITNNIIDLIDNKFLIYLKDTYSFQKELSIIQILKNTILELTTFIINTIGIILIFNNQLNILTLITFNTLLIYYLNPIENLINLLPKITLIKLSFDKVNEILSLKEEMKKEEYTFTNGDIIFSNITYSYDDYYNIINNLNLKINYKDRILITGKSGIGKSTICQLLNGNIEDYKGKITINNINIKDYDINTIRNNIRYVSQKEQLFTNTLIYNITLGKEYTLEEINKVLEITKINDILDKKEFRYNTLLTSSGSNLSGGERQRLILARSIINKPNILILDESLSEVDPILERDILNNLSKYLEDSTIIYITHHNLIDGFKIIDLNDKESNPYRKEDLICVN